jgi:hypothetical protein
MKRAPDSPHSKYAHVPLLLLITVILVPTILGAQRPCCEGDWWLKWTKAQRESYVWGYMTGFSHAYPEGCLEALRALPARPSPEVVEAAKDQCYLHQPDFSKGTTYWVKEVTDFYKTYAQDRDIYISEVLEQLGNGLTLEQIHKYPFMRRRVPTSK